MRTKSRMRERTFEIFKHPLGEYRELRLCVGSFEHEAILKSVDAKAVRFAVPRRSQITVHEMRV